MLDFLAKTNISGQNKKSLPKGRLLITIFSRLLRLEFVRES